MQYNVQEQNAIREEALRVLWKALAPLKEFVNKNNNYYEERTSIEQKAQHIVSEIREIYRDLQYYDPLKERLHGSIRGVNKSRIFCFNAPCESRNITYFPENFWPDDFVQCWKEQDINKLHYKDTWFRVGNDFYKKDDYLLYNGVVYSKKEYAINKNNELVSLKESIPVGAYFYHDYRNEIDYNDWLTPKDVEMQQLDDSYDHLIRLKVYINRPGYGYRGKLLSRNYWLSMFKFGDKRIFRKNDSVSGDEIWLSEDMIRKIELSPSKDHHRIWKEVKAVVDKCIEDDRSHAGGYPKMSENGEGVLWRLTFNISKVKTASIRDKIIRNVADGAYLDTNELKRRLELLKDVLNVEAQYVKAK